MANVECGAMGTIEVKTSMQQEDSGAQQLGKALAEVIGIAELKIIASDYVSIIIVDHE
jgi:hypothetical protein